MMMTNEKNSKSKKSSYKHKKESKKEAKKRLNEERRANKRKKQDTNTTSNLYITQLERIVAREPEIIKSLLAKNKWIHHGGTMICKPPPSTTTSLFKDTEKATKHNIAVRGCTVAVNDPNPSTHPTTNPLLGPTNPTFTWGKKYNSILQQIDATMESLKTAGWPPVFVFLFDEPWLLIDRLFELVAPILGPNCLLETSMYGWALSKPSNIQNEETKEQDKDTTTSPSPPPTTTAAEVGGNFPIPHRDNSFKECNFPDGTPSHLSTWMCINDVGLDNGCMHILPKDADPNFNNSDDYWHERVAYSTVGLDLNQKLPTRKIKPPANQMMCNFSMDKVLPMPAPFGSVLLWQPNCVHWGSSCSSSSFLSARKSLAMTFRCSVEKRPIDVKIERDLLAREDIWKLSIEDRLVMVVESILMYAKWFPNFEKFDLSLLGMMSEAE